MFYSPKKNIEAFIEAKNEEIKALKQKILGTRVTFEQMAEARERLDKLKAAHTLLEREDYEELRDLLRTTQQAIADLTSKKNKMAEELEGRKKDVGEMGELMEELAQKKERTENYHREVTDIKGKLVERKEKKSQQILELQEEIEARRHEIQMELSIADELAAARLELGSKIQKGTKELSNQQEENAVLRHAIKEELAVLAMLEHSQETDELRIENLGLRIANEEKQAQNYLQKIESGKTFLQRVAEDRLTLIKECETAGNVDSLLQLVTETSQCRQQEQDECTGAIQATQDKIQKAALKKRDLDRQVLERRENLKELKEKGQELKSILNSIFHEDSNVLKILADKKVHEEPLSPTSKKSTEVPDCGELAQLKQDVLGMIGTSDNFFMTHSG